MESNGLLDSIILEEINGGGHAADEGLMVSNGLLGMNATDMDVLIDVEKSVESLDCGRGQPGPPLLSTSTSTYAGRSHGADTSDSNNHSNGLLGSGSGAESSWMARSPGVSMLNATSKYLAAQTAQRVSFEAILGNGRSVFIRRRERRVLGQFEMAQPSASASTSTATSTLTSASGAGTGTNSFQLLETPIWKLRQERKEDQDRRTAEKLQEQYDREAKLLRRNALINGSSTSSKGKERENVRQVMWVDKYRPTKFTDLLGDERCHREVLGWLKEWDRCVFKTIAPIKKRPRDGELGGVGYSDPIGRPRDRILLMSGPPGLGKTTLAHIVAKQAGYEVFEVNASDDRTASTVSNRIQNAIDAGSGLRSKGRPTCVIIDEIDGAAGGGDSGFIKSLCKLIQDVPARVKTNTPAKLLRRPIICICNDLYAPALRPLRQSARIIRFRKSQPALMVSRLKDICQKETLQADTRSLTTLVEITNADVRSCLNTLQFIQAKAGEVSEKSIRQSAVGLKDAGSSLAGVWHNLFVPPTTKRKKVVLGAADGKYVNRLAFEIQASGDMDKVVQGCFEHYPNLKPIDTSLNNINKIHNWVHFFDVLSGRVGRSQEFELMAYMPYGVVPWHPHMGSPANMDKPTEFPKADYECFLQTQVNKEIAVALAGHLPPSLKGLYTPDHILTELAPVLIRIISPNLKPVNANLVKPEEKATLARLVQIMIDLGLRFVRDRTEDGQPTFKLEPPIDVFIHYDGKRAGDVATARYAVRQLVSQAIDAELARRVGVTTKNALGGGQHVAASKDDPNGEEKPPTDFFGRLLAVGNTGQGEGDEPVRPVKKFRVMYRYNEGSSSAVRKPIKMSVLM